jgi:hypothetical protein
VPGGAAPRALLGVLALIVAFAVAIGPVVEARPKDRNNKQDKVAEETVPGDSGQSDIVPGVEQPLTAGTNAGSSNERTLLELDADGDYIPDALDNCPSVQNPDQADADGDGNGDPCTVYQDTDGDTVPDKSDNCPNIATADFSDRDGDGVGDSCDKSPDGIEPEPEPVPELDGQGDAVETEPPPPENGENLNGEEVERDGRSRSRQRDRTEISKPIITTGADSQDEGIGGPPAQEEPPAEEPVRDNPRRNEELIAEAAASGELYAPPEPPPAPQRAWEEEDVAASTEWDSIVKIDAGAASAAESTADDESNDAGAVDARQEGGDRASGDMSDLEVQDSNYARGWVRAKLLLQEDLREDESANDDDAGDGEARADRADDDAGGNSSAPVPVENGLVITGPEEDDGPPRATERKVEPENAADDPEAGDEPESLDEAPGSRNGRQDDKNRDAEQGASNRDEQSARKDGSRRDGSSRGAAAAAPERQREPAADAERQEQRNSEKKRRQRRAADGGVPAGWNSDRYFDGGSALNWSGDLDVVGTDDPDLYLTQRSGSGPGKRRGFSYAIPVDESGVYMVRLYFAEPYWGSPGGPEGEEGRRVFSVTAEGEVLIADLDIYAEVGELTALVKQAEVDVQDGELNLTFTAVEGEPIVAAIEILTPAR